MIFGIHRAINNFVCERSGGGNLLSVHQAKPIFKLWQQIDESSACNEIGKTPDGK